MSTYIVIPCGGEKRDQPSKARDLYTGAAFTIALKAALDEAEACGGEVLILSALHGLLRLDDVVAPYDMKMTDKASISAEEVTMQAVALGIDYGDEVYAMLPGSKHAPYFPRLDAALRPLDVYAQDVYEAAPGIGYQRGVCSTVLRTGAQVDAYLAEVA